MMNKKITINKNLILILTLIVVLVSCSSKNKTIDNVNNSQAIVSEVNYISDKNTDIMFLETIYFDFDSYVVTLESKQNLSLLARYLKDLDNKRKNVVLSGYCDELGTEQYNYELGLKRAEQTKNYLISLGVSKPRINVKSYGKDRQSRQSKQYLLKAGMNKNRIITKSYGKAEQITKENLETTRTANRKVVIKIY